MILTVDYLAEEADLLFVTVVLESSFDCHSLIATEYSPLSSLQQQSRLTVSPLLCAMHSFLTRTAVAGRLYITRLSAPLLPLPLGLSLSLSLSLSLALSVSLSLRYAHLRMSVLALTHTHTHTHTHVAYTQRRLMHNETEHTQTCASERLDTDTHTWACTATHTHNARKHIIMHAHAHPSTLSGVSPSLSRHTVLYGE